jgi:hypothetical protein
LHQRFKLGDGVVDGIAGWNHDPDGAGSCEVLYEILQRVDAEGAGGCELCGGFLVEVEADDLVASETETLRHIEAHFAETNNSKFHVRYSLNCL